MRILFVVHSFPPDGVRGAQVQTRLLARALARDHEIAVAYPVECDAVTGYQARTEETSLEDITVYKVWRGPNDAIRHLGLSHAGLEAALGDILGRWHPDVCHVHHLLGWPLTIVDRMALTGAPLVATLHDFYPMCHQLFMTRPDWTPCTGPAGGLNCATYCRWVDRLSWPPPRRGIRAFIARSLTRLLRLPYPFLVASIDDFQLFCDTLYRGQMRRVMRLFDKVLCPSRFLMGHFARWVEPDRLAFCELGLDPGRFEGVKRRPSDVVRFGYMGGICYEKGVDLLVDVFNEIEPGRAVLKLHGETDSHEEAPAIRARARSASVSFEGHFDNDEVGSILAGIDCLVLPSRVSENSPIGIREAYLAGIPVIAPRRGGAPELVTHEVSGLLFEPCSVDDLRTQVRRMIEEPGLRERLAAGAPPVRSVADQAAELSLLYGKLCADAARPRRYAARPVLEEGEPA